MGKSSTQQTVIAIDGPAGSGKSTVAREVARKLAFEYLETGAMYRAFAWLAAEQALDPKQPAQLDQLCRSWNIRFHFDGRVTRVYRDDRDITDEIRTEAITEASSAIAVLPEVRRFLVTRQQARIAEGRVVLEGRDTTTVVAPNAATKVFLTADPQERARRRFVEYQDKGVRTTLDEQMARLVDRDYQDSHRKTDPLRQAEDAIAIDTTNLTIDQVVQAVVEAYRTKTATPERRV